MTKIQFSIVKNNDFATIGFHVYFGNHRTFTWGIADEPSLYYVKKQDANEESMEKILELMNLEREHRIREDFVRDFFETAKANGIDVTRGYKFNSYDEKLSAITKRISNIINSFK